MEKPVNKRVFMLKTELGLTDIEFCVKAEISTGTLFRIKNDEEISQKTLNAITSAYNVNKDWLLHGKGKMLKEAKPVSDIALENPWKDEAYQNLKAEYAYLKVKYDQVLSTLLGKVSSAANFNEPTDYALFSGAKFYNVVGLNG